MDKILITGASGFIGSFLVEYGLQAGYEVYAGIRRSSSREYLKDPRIRFLEMDFSSDTKLDATLEACRADGIRFRYIVHNAGLTKARQKDDFRRVNCDNTVRFVEALRRTGMVPEKFLMVSSLAAYGPGDPVTGKPVRLDDEPRPIELYGRSKMEAENYLRSLDGFPWLIIRPTGVYGPREKDYFVFFQTISRGLEPYIGSRRQVLTFIYVRDLVKAIYLALASPHTRKAWFITDGREYTSEEFAKITKQVMGRKTFSFTVPLWLVRSIAVTGEAVAGLWGTIPTLNRDKYNVLKSTNWRCEHEPAERDLGFRAEYDLARGVEEAVKWYRQEKWL